MQRIMSCNKYITTSSEPWILLPFIYTLKRKGCFSEYNHLSMVNAIEDFYNALPEGKYDYLKEIRSTALNLYNKVAGNDAKYFLDKTPRYHLISEEIIQLFPDGKYIFLWRNPLAIIASIINTWFDGRWHLHVFEVDLFNGLYNLVNTYQKYSSDVLAVRYEDLILNSSREWKRIYNYLEIPFDPKNIDDFHRIRLKGRFGDKTGEDKYRALSSEPIYKWKKILSNPIRKAWCKHYLSWIGPDRIKKMGYNLDELQESLKSVETTFGYMGSDSLNIIYGFIKNKLKSYVFNR